MLAQTICWAAALLPLSLAAPSPSVAATSAREPLAQGLHFRSSALDPVDATRATFRGVYGGSAQDAVYVYSVDDASRQEAETIRRPEDAVLVWIGLAGVEGLADDVVARAFKELDSLSPRIEAYQQSFVDGSTYATDQSAGQSPFGVRAGAGPAGEMALEILTSLTGEASTTTAVMANVSPALLPVLDFFLPFFLVPVVLPHEGYPAELEGVPKERTDYLETITRHVKFSPKIDEIVQSLSIKQLEKDIAWLTGEAPESPILSRHSFSTGAVVAAHYLKEQVESTGASCTLEPFLAGFAPNVICHYPFLGGREEEKDVKRVIISGHYDSRGSFGSTRAPGGDDDGSGSGSVLAIARSIKASNITGFKHQATLAFFAGEEQGLLGSHAYFKRLHEEKATVLLHVQSDMLAYRDENETLQLGFPESIGSPAAAALLTKLAGIYSPELVVGTTAACCSDHQSSNAFGFPSTQMFERNGGIIDPMYHNTGDVSRRAGYDLDQVKSISKVTLAGLLEVAEYVQ